MSRHTKSLIQYCIDDDIICSGTIHVSIRKLYSYCSRINQSTSFLDHLLFSRELLKHVVKFSIIDDIENSSDHLPMLIGVNLPINEVSCETTSRFIPTT